LSGRDRSGTEISVGTTKVVILLTVFCLSLPVFIVGIVFDVQHSVSSMKGSGRDERKPLRAQFA
jgi:hypothetical protein